MEWVRLAVLLSVYVLHITSGRCPQGRYGFQCGYSCNCLDAVCNSTYGCRSQTCSRGWSGPTCQKNNKALGKSTSASSVHLPARKAVDGNTIDTTNLDCFHSVYKDARVNVAWWRVDLNETTPIHDVTIYFRTDNKVRRNGIQVYVADTAASPTDGVNCYNVTGKGDGSDIPDVLNVTCSGKGRYLVLYTTTKNNGDSVPILDFCEVQVNVCAPGTFGSDCDNYCYCAGDVCNFVNGVCPSGLCLPGWQHDECDTECTQGSYGQNCRHKCYDRNCKDDNSRCNHTTGMCVGGCEAGWKGTGCTQKCTDSYGDGCAYQCSARNCRGTSTCDHVTGKCEDGCNPGWKRIDCTQECTKGVEYGSGCVGKCSARRCDGGTDACPPDTGQCESTCLTGWQGEDCAQVSVARIGVIGGAIGMAIGMAVMLLLVVGLFMCLLKHGRLKWLPSNGADPKEGRKTSYTEEIPTHTPTPGVGDPDYTELNDVTRERVEKSQYDVIQNKVYENNQI